MRHLTNIINLMNTRHKTRDQPKPNTHSKLKGNINPSPNKILLSSSIIILRNPVLSVHHVRAVSSRLPGTSWGDGDEDVFEQLKDGRQLHSVSDDAMADGHPKGKKKKSVPRFPSLPAVGQRFHGISYSSSFPITRTWLELLKCWRWRGKISILHFLPLTGYEWPITVDVTRKSSISIHLLIYLNDLSSLNSAQLIR